MHVTTLGDLLLDVIVRTGESLLTGDDRPATTLVGAGGQAANVAAWVAALGGSARFVGKRGDDAAGELVSAELRAYGVDVTGPVEGRTGVVVSIAAGGERTMASARAAELARAGGGHVSVDLSTWSSIDDAFRTRVGALAPDVVFAGERERDTFGALTTDWIVKQGAQGVIAGGEQHAAVATEVVDTTGAGDALAAGFLVGGVELGLEAAARCVAKLGAMP
jgi:ribokinase